MIPWPFSPALCPVLSFGEPEPTVALGVATGVEPDWVWVVVAYLSHGSTYVFLVMLVVPP